MTTGSGTKIPDGSLMQFIEFDLEFDLEIINYKTVIDNTITKVNAQANTQLAITSIGFIVFYLIVLRNVFYT